jgi:hypothetical protein
MSTRTSYTSRRQPNCTLYVRIDVAGCRFYVQTHTLLWYSDVGCRVQLKCDGTRWRTGGEVKGKLANGVGSQYFSHYIGTCCVSSITTADAYTLAPSSRLNWRPTRRFKWTRPFCRKTKSGFCACAITFQLASIYSGIWELYPTAHSIQNSQGTVLWNLLYILINTYGSHDC